MENATKALIIAGTVFISLLVISVLVHVFNIYSDYAYENQQKQVYQQKVQFNINFEKYIGQELALQDVVTIANLAKEYNEKYGDSEPLIVIKVQDIGSTNNIDWNQKLDDEMHNTKQTIYTIDENKVNIDSSNKSVGYDDYGIINYIYITKLR